MAPKQQTKADSERPPAEQVARENYEREFGTTKPDATLPTAEIGHTDPQDAPVTPVRAVSGDHEEN